MRKLKFKIFGYYLDIYYRGKYVGNIRLDKPDREVMGYSGRITEILTEDLLLIQKNGTPIKLLIPAGMEITSMCYPLCGRLEGNRFDQINTIYNSKLGYGQV